MISPITIILLLCTINVAFGRYYYDNFGAAKRQYYGQRNDGYYAETFRQMKPFQMQDSFRQESQQFPKFDDSRFSSFYDFKKPDPNINRPLPLPLKDAIRYVRQYGPHADMLRQKEEEARNYRFSDAVNHFRNKKRSEDLKCQRRKKNSTCKRDVNGCGSGFTEGIPFFFRETFTPCCNKHDVCYDCGVTVSWTRTQCDTAFYEDMVAVCECDYPDWSQYPQYLVCRLRASELWAAVDVFAGSFFGTKKKEFCKQKCLLPYGSPDISLLE